MLKNLNIYSRYSKFDSSIKIVLLLFGVLLSLSGCERISDPMLPDDRTLEAGTTHSNDLQRLCREQRGTAPVCRRIVLQVPIEVANMYNNVDGIRLSRTCCGDCEVHKNISATSHRITGDCANSQSKSRRFSYEQNS